MVDVSAITQQVASPPVIVSSAGLIPTLRQAGLVAETWQESVSLAVAAGEFTGSIGGERLTPGSALELSGDVDKFAANVDVSYGAWLLDSFEFRAWSVQEHRPVGCGDAYPWAPQCVAEDQDVTKTVSSQPERVVQYPLQIQASDQCSTWAPNLEERKRRALANLLRKQSNVLGAELWSGAQALANGWPNLSLSQSATQLTGPGESSPSTLALAALQENLAEELGDGQAGLIHGTRATIQRWYADGNIWFEKAGTARFSSQTGYLTDIYGNIFVASGGYDGSDPDGIVTAQQPWAYASGPVVVRLGDIEVLGGEWAHQAPALTENNLATVFAERFASYTLDGCAIFGIAVNLCCADCSESGS